MNGRKTLRSSAFTGIVLNPECFRPKMQLVVRLEENMRPDQFNTGGEKGQQLQVLLLTKGIRISTRVLRRSKQ
jgi:hypothetical protein